MDVVDIEASPAKNRDGRPHVGLFRYVGNNHWDLYEPAPFISHQKVLLYVHGWKPNSSGVMDGFVTDPAQYGSEVDTLQPWIHEGYLVLSFQWHPYADEFSFLVAERKIWDATATRRWRGSGGPYIVGAPRDRDMGEEFFEAYTQAFSGLPDLYIHLVGHSLGTQMASRLLMLLMLSGTRPLPRRLTFLDPYFSSFAKPYLGNRWPGQVVRDVVARLIKDHQVPVEQYKSSRVLDNPLSDTNPKLQNLTAYFVLRPHFIPLAKGLGDVDALAYRHSACRYLYFWSKACPPAPEFRRVSCGTFSPTGETAGYANVSDPHLWAMMGTGHFWQQCRGLTDPNPAQHAFLRLPAPLVPRPLPQEPVEGRDHADETWASTPA